MDLLETTKKQENCEKLQKQILEIRKFVVRIDNVKEMIHEIPEILDFRKAARIIGRAEDKISSLQKSKRLENSIFEKEGAVEEASEETKLAKRIYEDTKLEYEKAIDEFDICPTCGQEVTAECKAEMIEGV